jgi:DNA-binding PadR family transcriptional regulator
LTADDGSRSRPIAPESPGIRRSRTRFVALGMLALGPASAYALRQRIASSVGFFWQESFGQLFPTLAQLEREGLVSGRSVSEGKRRRRDYEITPAGESTLAAWLHERPAPQPERNELLLKVFFANPGDVDALGSFIAHADADARAQVKVLRGIEVSLRESYATDPRLPFWLLTVRYGILGNEALVRWCKEARQAVAASA